MDILFGIAHSANFSTSVQSLVLIQQLARSRLGYLDRFYRSLYESLLEPRLAASSKQAPYLNLLLQALKSDVDSRRVKAFVKRILQILSLHQPAFACGLLYIAWHLFIPFPDLVTLLEQPEEDEILDDEGGSQAAPVGQGHAVSALGRPPGSAYNGRKRDPEHSNASHSCLWEVVSLLVVP
jgi:ribosome biogenesis protein MAK21